MLLLGGAESMPKVIPGRVTWLSPLPKETNDAQLFAQSAHAPDQTGARPRLLHCPSDLTALAFAMMPVFHELSRAEGPSQQVRKSTPHIGESPEASGVFHEVSRAERPSQQGRKTTAGSGLRTRGQTGLAANFRQNAPEIHASLVSPGGASEWR